MYSKTRATLAVLLVVASATIAAPRITGEVEVKAGGFAVLTIDGANKTVLWTITPEPVQEAELFGTLVFTGTSGVTYTATAVVIDFDSKSATKLKHTVRFGGDGPKPVPPVPPDPPKPDPKPDPIVAGKLFVVVVEETRQATAERGVFFADKELAAYMESKGHKRRVVDKDVMNSDGQTPADIKRFVDDAKAKTLPMLYLVGEDGKTRRAGPMVASPKALLELLKQYGG